MEFRFESHTHDNRPTNGKKTTTFIILLTCHKTNERMNERVTTQHCWWYRFSCTEWSYCAYLCVRIFRFYLLKRQASCNEQIFRLMKKIVYHESHYFYAPLHVTLNLRQIHRVYQVLILCWAYRIYGVFVAECGQYTTNLAQIQRMQW